MDQITRAEPNPVDREGLCLLSLDGGGVRGLSTLFILKGIMTRLNYERKEAGLPSVKPCEVFDLIGGTSTGGLIAIMLGRLEMDVDECISTYIGLMKKVFGKKSNWLPISLRGGVKAQFDSKKLRSAVEQAIKQTGASPEDQFNDGQPRGCRVFVCAAAKETSETTRLRSYSVPGKIGISATILDAALATSAATRFFDPVRIGARQFVDGALGANNPVEQVEREATDIWCADTAELMPLVKCFLSLGTGHPGRKAIEDNMFKLLSQTLVGMATETVRTEARFIARWRQHYVLKRYFRFNVDHGLEDVGLGEYDEQGTIEAATDNYLDHTAQIARLQDCVSNLKQKQNGTPISFASIIHENSTRLMSKQPRTNRQPCQNIPFPKNKNFVSRASVDDVLKKLFNDNDIIVQRVAIVGLGGIGKTQVALQTAYWTRQSKPDWSVFWVPMLSGESFEQACREIALTVGLGGDDKKDVKELVYHYLESVESGHWLLVVDNVDDEQVIFGAEMGSPRIYDFLPRNDQGRILFTTRSQRVASMLARSEVIQLFQMTEGEARKLMEELLAENVLLRNEQDLAKLLEVLAYLPLAIAQAAAYLNENRETIDEYIRLLGNTEQDMVELLSTEFADDARYPKTHNAVASTWVVSFEQIRKDADAAKLLLFMAYVEPKAIPRSMLPQVGTEQRMTRALGLLHGYSFLSRRDDKILFDMHRLVHLALGVWEKTQNGVEKRRCAALQHLGAIYQTDDWDCRETWRQYIPHVLRAIQTSSAHGEWKKEECHLGYWIGRCLLAEGRSKEAIVLIEHVVAVHKTTLAESHPDRLASQHVLATAYQADGRGKEAIALLEHVVAVCKTTLAESHPNRLASQHELARAYKADGRGQEAITLLEHVIAVHRITLAESHPDRLTSQHILATVYQANGRGKEAITLLEHVVAVRKITLAESHPQRLASQHVLAMAYKDNGRGKEAITLLEHVIAVYKTTLAESHPDRLASQHELARAYKADGRRKEAIALLKHVIAVHKTTLAESHPDRLTSQHVLATVYQADGRGKEAIALLEHVVAVRKTTLAESHPDRLVSQQVLASVYQADGRGKEAIALLEHVVAVYKTTLAESHPHRLASQHELERAYRKF